MGRACLPAMTPSATPPPPPAAVAAFLRGVDRRARLLARVQAGDAGQAERALAVTARVFASDAGQWPIPHWPMQYWRLLLATPAMHHASNDDAGTPLPDIARLAPAMRAAVLLHQVAELGDNDASAALGITVETYQQRIRDALPPDAQGQPDVETWRVWRSAAQGALAAQLAPSAPSPQPLEAASTAAAPPPAAREGDDTRRHHRRMRWLWLGVALCATAMVATFFLHPKGRALLEDWFPLIQREALPPAAAPKARFDAEDPTLHPDHALLTAPAELHLARLLPLLAWWQVAREAALPAADTLPPAHPAETDTPEALLARMRAWNQRPAHQRSADRLAWAAWQHLTAPERDRLRVAGQHYDALPAEEKQALRDRYAALGFDAHRGWHLGPSLGRDWPRIAPLFTYVEAGERDALLQLLRELGPADLDTLARLAQITPPEQRSALRADLRRLPADQRSAWLQARLQQ